MRQSIRNQILIPLLAVQVATVATIVPLVASWLATARVELADLVEARRGEVETLGRSRFRLTSDALEKMRGIFGCPLRVVRRRGQGPGIDLAGPGSVADSSLRIVPEG